MASIQRYYDYDKSRIPYYTILNTIDNHYASLLFKGDTSRVITASNAYALRVRSDQNKDESNLNFPFMNYRRTSWDFDDQIGKWQIQPFSKGIFIDDLGIKIRTLPVIFTYESTFWFTREDDLAYAYRTLRFDSDNLTELDYSVMINDVEVPLWSWLNYSNLEYDPDYNENDWLEQNKIKTISMNIELRAFDIEPATNDPIEFALTEKVIHDISFRSNAKNTLDEKVALEWMEDNYYNEFPDAELPEEE